MSSVPYAANILALVSRSRSNGLPAAARALSLLAAATSGMSHMTVLEPFGALNRELAANGADCARGTPGGTVAIAGVAVQDRSVPLQVTDKGAIMTRGTAVLLAFRFLCVGATAVAAPSIHRDNGVYVLENELLRAEVKHSELYRLTYVQTGHELMSPGWHGVLNLCAKGIPPG